MPYLTLKPTAGRSLSIFNIIEALRMIRLSLLSTIKQKFWVSVFHVKHIYKSMILNYLFTCLYLQLVLISLPVIVKYLTYLQVFNILLILKTQTLAHIIYLFIFGPYAEEHKSVCIGSRSPPFTS